MSCTHDTRSLETASAATLGLSGVILLLPPATFAVNPVAFSAMRFLPETAWGGLLMMIGLAQSYAVARDNADHRRHAALAAVAMYSFLAVLYFIPNPVSLGMVTWSVYAAGNLWALWTLGRRDGS